MKNAISAVINTKNSAETLERTLESLRFVDEIIVVDMHSSDDTRSIAKKYQAKVFLHEDVGFVEPARNFALSKASYDWILLIDADEVIPTVLAKKLKELTNKPEINGFYIPRKNNIWGVWTKHKGWWPDYQMRFFRKGTVIWSDKIHSQPEISGSTQTLEIDSQCSIEHYNYPTVSSYLQRLDRYTSIAALQKEKKQIQKSLLASFFSEFVRQLFVYEGIKQGSHSVALSLLQSIYEVVIPLKQMEKKGITTRDITEKEVVAELDKQIQVLAYWRADWYVRHNFGLTKIYWLLRKKVHI